MVSFSAKSHFGNVAFGFKFSSPRAVAGQLALTLSCREMASELGKWLESGLGELPPLLRWDPPTPMDADAAGPGTTP